MTSNCKTTALIILDGFGYREKKSFNAIAEANTPNLDRLMKDHPNCLISTSGVDVGLPSGQMGNSEVGHMTLGSGRVVEQALYQINQSIDKGEFVNNEVLSNAAIQAVQANKAIHLLGLLSAGGVHSDEAHFHAMIDLAKKQGAKKIYVHAFLDGRDTAPRSAETSLEKIDERLRKEGLGQIATIIGRYYAMDRDQRWDRIEQAYDLLTKNKSSYQASSAVEGLKLAYKRRESDEFVKATSIEGGESIVDGDSVVFMNFRSDRARQLAYAFTDSNFIYFKRQCILKLSQFVTLTKYAADMKAKSAFLPQEFSNTLGEYISSLGKTQLRIAETEKYAHVTFFFSGGREEPFPKEERILINSPKVATYDLRPEMSAYDLTQNLIEEIQSGYFDLIICNYANCDMVGHTGDYNATITAVEVVDFCIGKVLQAIKEVGGQCLVTADHGNAEQMVDEQRGVIHTAHTCEPVPLLYYGDQKIDLHNGSLSDIAPTILTLMEIEPPKEMTGKVLSDKNI